MSTRPVAAAVRSSSGATGGSRRGRLEQVLATGIALDDAHMPLKRLLHALLLKVVVQVEARWQKSGKDTFDAWYNSTESEDFFLEKVSYVPDGRTYRMILTVVRSDKSPYTLVSVGTSDYYFLQGKVPDREAPWELDEWEDAVLKEIEAKAHMLLPKSQRPVG